MKEYIVEHFDIAFVRIFTQKRNPILWKKL